MTFASQPIEAVPAAAAPAAPARPAPQPRSAYRAFRSISTRWADNDVYGHVNNVIYYSWFDTAVNAHLIEQGALVQLLCTAGVPADHRGGHSRGPARRLQRAL
jgi:hypothetical protein